MIRIAHCCCGSLRAEATGEPAIVAACHCTECQRRTGSPFGVTTLYPKEQVRTEGPSKVYVRGSMRVNVQLIDANTGNHLWAERFDSPVADLLDMQDDIVSRLARQLDVELIAAEARRAELSPNPDSFDLYFRGKASYNKGLTPEDRSHARDFFERALVLDRGNLDAQVGTAAVDVVAANTYQAKDQRSRLAAAEKALTNVLLCAPNHAYAHFLMGMTLTLAGRPAQGVAECERALALDKNLAAARAFIGLTKLRLGRV
jgi:hypothetical protein